MAAALSAAPADPMAISRVVAGIPMEVRYSNCVLLKLSMEVKKMWNLKTPG